MFENTNQEVIREIAKENLREHKLRNVMGILAIALTTLLITVVCTVGWSFYDTLEKGTDITPGPMSDGAIKATQEQYEQIEQMEQVKWADYVRPAVVGSLHNKEAVGLTAKVFAPGGGFYEDQKVELLDGTYPETADEIAVSSSMAKHFGYESKAGWELKLKVVILDNGSQVEREIPMRVCGIVESPLHYLKDTYEELYVAESFITKYNPEMENADRSVYLKLDESSYEGDVYGALQVISQEVGGSGVTYKIPNTMDGVLLLAVAGFLAVIIFAGYLLIYNIFYISVVNDIRFYGMMKTIGTSPKQVKALLTYQVSRLAVAGILVGLLAGYLIGIPVGEAVMRQSSYGAFYEAPKNPLLFVAAVIFAILTVLISSRKSYKTASMISPVEAAKYRGSSGENKRKKLWSVLSLALGCVIFIVVYCVTIGYNVRQMIERYECADVTVRQKNTLWEDEEQYHPIRPDLVDEIKDLPFVKDVKVCYQARNEEASRRRSSNPEVYSGESAAYVKNDKILHELKQAYSMEEDLDYWLTGDENMGLCIQGIPARQLSLEHTFVHVLEGELDSEKFATGDYVIYRQFVEGKTEDPEGVHAGDVLHLSFWNDSSQSYVERDLKVLAVIYDAAQYSQGVLEDGNLTLLDGTFQEIYPDYPERIAKLFIDGIEETTDEQTTQIKEMLQKEFNSQILISSRMESGRLYAEQKQSMMVLGLFLAFVFGMIGITNVVNTLVTGVISRKLEYAAMQSVGMTKKQMKHSIAANGLSLSVVSLAAAFLLGGGLAYVVASGIPFFTGFTWGPFVTACLLLVVVVLFVNLAVAAILTRMLNKKPVVERLREAE
ncbi:MAG: ABC transporter permease [Blautia sp.]|jgi:putative ABC transport system permease protein